MPNEPPHEKNNLLFIKEVAQYFMDFLETDFHRRRLPRRSINFRNSDNLLIGLNLQKYASFNNLMRKFVIEGFEKKTFRIEKGVYKTTLPKNLLALVKLKISKVSISQFATLTERLAAEVEKAATLYAKEYDTAFTSSLEEAAKIIRSELVNPFIESIEKPLQNMNLGDESNIYLIEEELTTILLHLLESKISETLNLTIAKEKINIVKEIRTVFGPQDVKSNLSSFFANLQVADLFLELFEMERNKGILDKQDFYLYFGDISFRNTKYPIFYIPLEVSREGDVLTVEFDSQIYINKKALEFIVQEYNSQKGTKGGLKTISERIIYLAQHEEDLPQVISGILNELTHFFELDAQVNFSSTEAIQARGALVRASNNCHICLFDKSDEALVNDYEEILQQLTQEEGVLANIFNTLIGDFIHKNPKSFNQEVEDEWDGASTTDKLVFPSPIPLNSEQRQILSAINRDECKYIIVEGPPGTGKSHTITAIIFDAILKNKSTLVLSDKKEALDVVEKNIKNAMDKVRYGENFQNPILRLGKTGNTYNSILARNAIEEIKIHHRAVRGNYDAIKKAITRSANSLKSDLETEILAYGDINIQEIHELLDLELHFKDTDLLFDTEELAKQDEAAVDLGDLRNSLRLIGASLNSGDVSQLLEFVRVSPKAIKTLGNYEDFLGFLGESFEQVQKIKLPGVISSLRKFPHFTSKDLPTLHRFIQEYSKLKRWLFGYLFTEEQAEQLDVNFKEHFKDSSFLKPHEVVEELQTIYAHCNWLQTIGVKINKKIEGDFDFLALAHQLLVNEDFAKTTQQVIALNEAVNYLKDLVQRYPITIKNWGIDVGRIATILSNRAVDISEQEFDKQIRYLNLKQKIGKDFSKIQEPNYASRLKQIEDLVATQVTHLLDGRVIDFYEQSRNDAQTLRKIIRNKERFPKDEFGKLKQAFPCILAGIRDYAEYIPLQPEIFDLVIIDEASQVSIAQAFPALLRAKKVLILGDKKQFSNVKAAQARSDTNKEYLNKLNSSFRENVSADAIKLARLEKFNIKTSILEFFEFIGNYTIQLRKHFRGYKEIISYSNKFFYGESLQVMKIRGKPIDEVIKFSPVVETSATDEPYPNTNLKEVNFIISELQRIKLEGRNLSVGIITPHTNQQKLLAEKINQTAESEYFLKDLQLKIMTFDTCQGEERDIIYYSMVASPHSDKLWGVFIMDLSNVDIEEDGQIKAQRLNVGFSRAKECVYFVLSKPTKDFRGSIQGALQHYENALSEARKERSVTEVDVKSKMEPEVMSWFYQTKFWQEHKGNIDFRPQFELGKYLRQLDPTYTHPEYRVDFLLIYTDERHQEHKIIIEYDGFREHFRDIDVINRFNYNNYYSDADVYRQKVLESYGYKFLRINKFNIGENPIATLDERIGRLVENSENTSPSIIRIHEAVEGLQSGEKRECRVCQKVKSLKDFKDTDLITGYGRVCIECKDNNKTLGETVISGKTETTLEAKDCPRCGSKMILRKGKYGQFFGCSRYPYCRGTRKISS